MEWPQPVAFLAWLMQEFTHKSITRLILQFHGLRKNT